MAWVYILLCSDGTYYVGSTVDLERRFGQHQAGEGAAYTRRRLPVVLLWAAQFSSIRDAFDYEKRVQGWGRAKREALMGGRFDLLPVLASRSWSATQVKEADELPEVPSRAASRDEPVMPWDGDVVAADDPDDPWARPVPRVEG